MSDPEKKRVRRTREERASALDEKIREAREQIEGIESKKQEAICAFDAKIDAIRGKIQALESKKEQVLSPKQRKTKTRRTKKQKIAEILKQAQSSGLKPEEIAEKLGIEIS